MAYTTAQIDAALDAANGGINFAQLHTGDPGASGTDAVLPEASPESITIDAAAAEAASGQVAFPISGATGSPISWVSLWIGDPGAGGTYAASGQLTPAETFAGAGTLTVTVNTTASNV